MDVQNALVPSVPQPEPPGNPTNPAARRAPRWVWVFLGVFLMNWLLGSLLFPAPSKPLSLPYSEFVKQVESGNVLTVSARGLTIGAKLKAAISYTPDKAPIVDKKGHTSIKTERPLFADDKLLELFPAKNVTVDAKPVTVTRSLIATVLIDFGPTLLIIGIMVWFWRRAAGGMSGIGGLGRSKAELYVPKTERTTFADVAGIDEAVQELNEIVDYLRNPARYRVLGAMIPKGVLLTGLPGTGKTLLARALAGEAAVPFFSMAASEFIEMIVGVGASRVRDLFDKARAAAPSIVFIDELDAIGRARGGSVSFGGHDEREQTLNQILTEMDGFSGLEGVIVLAATNRPEILDPALLRPGRFDRHIVVNPPDLAGREAILRVHTRKVPLAPETDLGAVASTTPGMVGADLRNLVNEAALLAARREHVAVAPEDFSDALERVLLGAERHIVLTLEERTRTAVHEAGHALVGMLQPGADPVRKVSIIPRGRALGVTFQSPDRDRYSLPLSYLQGRIVGALGGRTAEELVFGEPTTGAESDLETATMLARQMVGRWGMSDAIGPVSVLADPQHDEMFLMASGSTLSDQTRELVDSEVHRLIEECHVAARDVLVTNRDRLDRVIAALLANETLDEDEVYGAAGIDHEPSKAPEVAAGQSPPALLPAGTATL